MTKEPCTEVDLATKSRIRDEDSGSRSRLARDGEVARSEGGEPCRRGRGEERRRVNGRGWRGRETVEEGGV